MKRLSSYDWYYKILLAAIVLMAGIPLFFKVNTYKAFVGCMVGWGIGTGIGAIVQSFSEKRIYYAEGNLFLYNLFSKKFIILEKGQVIFLEHEFGSRWRLCYLVGDKQKDFSFRTKLSADEFEVIASSFNGENQVVPNQTTTLNPAAKP